MNTVYLAPGTRTGHSPGREHPCWGTGPRLTLALALALVLCGLLMSNHVPLAHAQTNCLAVTPRLMPQKNTIPTIEQLTITVKNGCATEAQNGSLHVVDSLQFCSGRVIIGLVETVAVPTLQVGQSATPFNIQEFQTGCPPGTVADGPLTERLHGDASATGPGGQAYTGSGEASYTFA